MRTIALTALAACGPVEEPPRIDTTVNIELSFGSCELVAGDPSRSAECASAEVPVEYGTFDDEQLILIDLMRLRPGGASGEIAIWMIGDPADGGDGLARVVRDMSANSDNTDFYLPDLRGAGRSSALTCGVQQASVSPGGTTITDAEWPACLDAVEVGWSENLPYFAVEWMADDLDAQIRASMDDGQRVVLYGLGGGARVVNQLLIRHPELPIAGVVFDGPWVPNRTIDTLDAGADETIRGYLDGCARDGDCQAEVGDTPSESLLEAFRTLGGGGCSELLGDRFADTIAASDALRTAIYELFLAGADRMPLIPALAARLNRCNAGDIAAIESLLDVVAATEEARVTVGRPRSPILGVHVGLSELWPSPSPTFTTVRAQLDGTIGAPLLGLDLALQAPIWPTYEEDPGGEVFSDYPGPVLLLYGDLDPVSSLDALQAYADAYGAQATLAAIPNGGHPVIRESATVDGGPPCGERLLLAFAADPAADLDTTCLGQVVLPTYVASGQVSSMAFGTTDAFNGEGGPPTPGLFD